ncbi:MAG: PAS domain S-box protein [Nanoarchaeota archaeon]|nr:PAS domain S-box protein [Nanoarchaeota archaeon]
MGKKESVSVDEKLRESEEIFRTIFDNVIVGILAADPKTKKFILANKEISKITGYSKEELLKLDVSKIHPKKDLPYVLKQFEKQLKKEIKVAHNLPVLRKDGKVVYCDISYTVEHIGGKDALLGIFREVTDEKKAEELRDRFKLLYDTSADAVMTLEPPTWVFTSGNPATIKMFNTRTEKKFVSLGPWQLSPKYQPDGQLSSVKAKKMIMTAMKSGSHFFEWTHKRYKGEDFAATVLLTRTAVGGKKFLQATVRDISESKKLEKEREESTAKFKALMEFSPDCIKLFDINRKLVYMSPGGLREHMLKKAEDAIGWDYLGSIVDEQKQEVKDAFNRALNGEIVSIDIKHLREKATREWCNLSLFPMRDADGKIKHIFGVSRDITQKKKAEDELKKKTAIIEHNFEAIALIDLGKSNLLTYVNPAWEKLFGYKSSEAVGKKKGLIIAAAKKDPELLKKFKESISKRTLFSADMEWTAKSGRNIIVEAILMPIKDDKGKVITWFNTIRDLTEKKKAEEELKKKLEELERFNKLTIGRELKMMELKNKIKKLEALKGV